MLLPELILDTLPEDSASGIRFLCSDSEKQKEIAEFFKDRFEEHWEEQKEAFEEEIGWEPDEIEVDILVGPEFSEKGVFFFIEPLDMTVNDGVRSYSEFGNTALEDAISDLRKKYPSLEYEGCVQYAWYDEHCGDTVSYELEDSVSKDKPYDFVGKIINDAIEYSNMLEELSWQCEGNEDEKQELLKIMEDYKEFIEEENRKKFLEAVEELGDD